MKNLLLILAWSSLIAVGCSSSSRTGYTYYDDVYDNRPSYSEDKRQSINVDDRPIYQETAPSNNSNENYENRRYVDDESSYSNYSGTYSDRIRRFNGSNSGFDYYSPYYTGYNDGYNDGFGYSSYGNYRPSFWNPFYSSSISFGWGRPSFGFGYNSWMSPSYYNPYYSYNPWYSPYRNNWNSPWSWGGNNHHYDGNPRNNNSYYGPRNGSYGNTYYNGYNQGGGRLNNSRGPIDNTPQNSTPNRGTFNKTPKYNSPSQPATTPSRGNSSPSRGNSPSKSTVPDRYKNNSSGYNKSTPSPSRGSSPSRSSTPSNRGSNNGGSQKSGGTMQRTNK